MKKIEFKKRINEILATAKIPKSLIGKRENFPGAKQAGIEIMLLAGMSKRLALSAVYGSQAQPKSDVSSYLLDIWNFCTMYDGCCLQYCIELAERYFSGNMECEVGLEYPSFNKELLIKRYMLTKTGLFEPSWSKERYEERKTKEPDCERTYYELWEDENKTVSFSFESGRMGEGGYAGATFDDFERALCFVEWFLNVPSHFVKDIDLFINRLGGLSLKEVKAIHNELIPA